MLVKIAEVGGAIGNLQEGMLLEITKGGAMEIQSPGQKNGGGGRVQQLKRKWGWGAVNKNPGVINCIITSSPLCIFK